MTSQLWFPHHSFTSLGIKKYKSMGSSRILKQLFIHDEALIQRIIARIEEIPTLGDLKIVLDEKSEKMELIFMAANEKHCILILNQRFQMPATGLFSSSNDFEEKLYTNLDTLIHPNRKKKFAKLQM